MLIFIDESGDTGLDFANGATNYFIIVLVAFEDSGEAMSCDQRIDLLRHELRLSKNFEFHFHQNSDRVREAFLRAVLPYEFFYYGIAINKAKLFGEGFKNKESFYKYSCGLLFENAKEKLRDATAIVDESGRALFKYQLAAYLRKKLNQDSGRKCLKKVKMQDSKRNNLLQLADMVVGAVNRSMNTNKNDHKRYREMVKSREIYVQIWPK
ncbi:MAG: DUF3800 domain-containing protein [Candidatus Magasanikbacteria bacterium]